MISWYQTQSIFEGTTPCVQNVAQLLGRRYRARASKETVSVLVQLGVGTAITCILGPSWN